MKKLLVTLCALLALTVTMFGLTSCLGGGKDSGKTDSTPQTSESASSGESTSAPEESDSTPEESTSDSEVTPTTYTITWMNGEEVLGTDEVEEGETPEYTGATPTKAADAEYTYTFTGWDPEVAPATEDATYTATFDGEKNTYTITWMNGEEVLDTEEYEYGETPEYTGEDPTKAADAQYTYTFTGWDNEIVAVTGDATYTATFNAITNFYTITWKNGEEVLDTEEYVYGETPEYEGEDPTKAATAQYTYTFTGWDPEVVAVTGDATYTATFAMTTNKYTITWKNGEDVLDTDEVEYGETPAYTGEAPTKAATAEITYTFNGWTPEIAAVTGEATYTATYSEAPTMYTLTIAKNEEGATVSAESVQVPYGATVSATGNVLTAGETDVTASARCYGSAGYYNFTSWTITDETVTEDATVTANFKKMAYPTTLKTYEDPKYFTFSGTLNEALAFPNWSGEFGALTGKTSYAFVLPNSDVAETPYTVTFDEDFVTTAKGYDYISFHFADYDNGWGIKVIANGVDSGQVIGNRHFTFDIPTAGWNGTMQLMHSRWQGEGSCNVGIIEVSGYSNNPVSFADDISYSITAQSGGSKSDAAILFAKTPYYAELAPVQSKTMKGLYLRFVKNVTVTFDDAFVAAAKAAGNKLIFDVAIADNGWGLTWTANGSDPATIKGNRYFAEKIQIDLEGWDGTITISRLNDWDENEHDIGYTLWFLYATVTGTPVPVVVPQDRVDTLVDTTNLISKTTKVDGAATIGNISGQYGGEAAAGIKLMEDYTNYSVTIDIEVGDVSEYSKLQLTFWALGLQGDTWTLNCNGSQISTYAGWRGWDNPVTVEIDPSAVVNGKLRLQFVETWATGDELYIRTIKGSTNGEF